MYDVLKSYTAKYDNDNACNSVYNAHYVSTRLLLLQLIFITILVNKMIIHYFCCLI
jgi:hypothetical protein